MYNFNKKILTIIQKYVKILLKFSLCQKVHIMTLLLFDNLKSAWMHTGCMKGIFKKRVLSFIFVIAIVFTNIVSAADAAKDNKTAMLDKLIGVWESSVPDGYFLNVFIFTIYKETSGAYKGIFEFYHETKTNYGSFYVNVDYSTARNVYIFSPYEWINIPLYHRYTLFDAEGTLNGNKLSATAPVYQDMTLLIRKFNFTADKVSDGAKPQNDVTNDDSASSWAQKAIDDAKALKLLPPSLDNKYQQNITRAEFCDLAVPLYEKIMNVKIQPTMGVWFSDTKNGNVIKMASLGVVKGKEANKFYPNDDITRQEAAVMLGRLMEKLDYKFQPTVPRFKDINTAADWARGYIANMDATGIMKGMENNTFAPLGKYTREQSIVTFMRIWDLIPSHKTLSTPSEANFILINPVEYGCSTVKLAWIAVKDAQIYAINWSISGEEGHIITDNTYVDLILPNVNGRIYVDIYACGSHDEKWVQSSKPLSISFDVQSIELPIGYANNPMRILADGGVYVFAERPTLWWILCVDQEYGFQSWIDVLDGTDLEIIKIAETASDNNLNYSIGSVWVKQKDDIVYSYGETYKDMWGIEYVKIYDPVICRAGWIMIDKIGN